MDPVTTEILVLGAGPGGYTAAFYAADKGKKVTLVEQNPRLGGVCMNVGCIPSKALLHATAILSEGNESRRRGIALGPAQVELEKLRSWKESIVEKLGQGIKSLAQHRRVELVHGRGHFEDSQTLRVETSAGQKFIRYEKAIIAAGSKPAMPHAFDLGNKRVMTSTEALDLPDIPQDLLVVGGGYIGMELGTVYAALGSHVVVLEALPFRTVVCLEGVVIVEDDLRHVVIKYLLHLLDDLDPIVLGRRGLLVLVKLVVLWVRVAGVAPRPALTGRER